MAASLNDLVSGEVSEIFEAPNVARFWVVETLVMDRACAEHRHAERRITIRDLGSAQIRSLVSLNHLKSALVASRIMLGAARRGSARGQSALLPL